ncbi:hypothetical protein W97_01766 [Coniosporium apollinis CBS 100218]|uniref:Opsin-1 n=1 Tax=Coniosporium apollinis (strain CBS 100218) TaxID=1168221 RepID=R7YKV4_CONA1|nr:uncharacterized protein W97_01766 [Coniosporium apollinis CBS 100218]EON62542.1 hypothetical protein W97_01766 [Coniosporium apollinis CBS 100218]
MIDPVQAFAKATSSLLVPLPSSSTAGHHHTSLPSILPDSPEYQTVGETGKRTLWVVFVIMTLASAAFAGMSWTVPINKRIFHFITTLITIFAALSYFAMATGHGVAYHHIVVNESHPHVPDTEHEIYRQVFFARYIDWTVTTPLLLLDLCLLAGLNGAHILMAIIADVIMILTGLFAAFGAESNPQKWGWYTISCIAYLVVIWHLALHGRAMAMSKGGNVARFFGALAAFTLILWTAYPIVWGFADGARRVSIDAEIMCYAVLDVLAKVGFGAWLLISHATIPEIGLELGGFWAHGLNQEGTLRVGDDDEGA